MSIILASPPAVIDEDLCRKCIGSLKTGAAGKEYEAKKDSIAFRDVQLLRLSYQNLLKMDNLVGFDKLVKLQLDNNIIEKIENLSHLTSLTQLDLSFNNISEIAGLDSLTSLTSLSLFSNRITQLGGMDTLSKLQVLSVGNNLLSQLDNIMYLRPFEELQAVNLVGNPFCQEEEYRRYVLAHLKHVKYLDYRLVDQQAVSSAKEQYQDELLELDETEGNKETQAVADEEKAKRVALHLSANMRGMDTIFEDIMMKGDGDFGERLRSLQPFQEPLLQLREQVEALAADYVATIMLHKDAKQKEKDDFSIAMEYAKAEASEESKAEIAQYNALVKQSLIEAGGEIPPATLQMLYKANDALFERLMDLEVSSSERYAEAISKFESSFDELSKRTQEELQVFTGKLRELEAAYHERVIAACTELLERVASDNASNLHDDARALLGDKEAPMAMVNGAHDARVARLDAKEDELRTLEQGANQAAAKAAMDAEYVRNRTRVVEIWNLSAQNKAELKLGELDNN